MFYCFLLKFDDFFVILEGQVGPENRSKSELGAKGHPIRGPGGPQEAPEDDFGPNFGSFGVPLGHLLQQFRT